MMFSIYGLIGLYAVLTGVAGIFQLIERKSPVRSVLFVLVAISMLVSLLVPNKSNMLILLIVAFIILHLLSIAEGLATKGKLTYRHHILRFLFHAVLVMLVYNFIV